MQYWPPFIAVSWPPANHPNSPLPPSCENYSSHSTQPLLHTQLETNTVTTMLYVATENKPAHQLAQSRFRCLKCSGRDRRDQKLKSPRARSKELARLDNPRCDRVARPPD